MTKTAQETYNFSKNLREIRNLALYITKNNRIVVQYDSNSSTSSYDPEHDIITLSLNPYPDFVKNNTYLAQKILDGDCLHECEHHNITKPIWEYYNNWITKIKRSGKPYDFAHDIVNVVEDKRGNYLGINRFRFDIGKRLLLANLILKDTIEENLKNNVFLMGKKKKNLLNILEGKKDDKDKSKNVDDLVIFVNNLSVDKGSVIWGIAINKGLYDANVKPLWDLLEPKEKEDAQKILDVLDEAMYQRLRIDLIKSCQTIWDIMFKYFPKGSNGKNKMFTHIRLGGQLKGDLSEGLKAKLNAEIKEEEEKEAEKRAKEMKEDLLKGSGAGEGTGDEIPTPEPNFEKYLNLVNANKGHIQELLNRLKVLMKPRVKREMYQRRGRMMSSILSQSYVNSMNHNLRNIYLNNDTTFEKEKVSIGFLVDFSGSVDRMTAENIITILNEVFGNYVEDYAFSLSVFGANSQKIKTFYETFETTKARIGNIGVDASGTEVSILLEAYLKMFNGLDPNRRKILVIASDFSFGDNEEAEKFVKLLFHSNVELLFIGFDCSHSEHWCEEIKAKRTTIDDVSELPEKFLSVYIDTQKG